MSRFSSMKSAASNTLSKLLNRVNVGIAMSMATMQAFAQTQGLQLTPQNDAVTAQGQSVMNTVGSWLLFFGLGTVTVCVMVQGYKMLFKKHQWSDVGHIFLGALFIGGAGTLAGIVFKVIS